MYQKPSETRINLESYNIFTYLVVGVVDHGGLPLALVAGVVDHGSLPGAATWGGFTGRVLDLGGLPLPVHVFVPGWRRKGGGGLQPGAGLSVNQL